MSFLVFRSTKYFKDNCCLKIVFPESVLSWGFAFFYKCRITYVRDWLKSNGIDFELHRLTIKEALGKPKRAESSPLD